jgi:hypothetical protein
MVIDILKYRRDCIISQRGKERRVLRPCGEKAGTICRSGIAMIRWPGRFGLRFRLASRESAHDPDGAI